MPLPRGVMRPSLAFLAGFSFFAGSIVRLSAFSLSRTSLRMVSPSSGSSVRPEKVFVAGASGRTGQRVVRELLSEGVKVTAAVRFSSVSKTETIFRKQGFMPIGLLEALEVKGVDMESLDSIAEAIDGCEAVVCALGASETEPLNFKAPYQVDFRMTEKVVQAAKETSSVRHFTLVSALGTGKVNHLPFYGVLFIYFFYAFVVPNIERGCVCFVYK
ncbi:unnamed protein product [Choristocarpus tenellus]